MDSLVVLLTGASRGIGAATAKILASRGASLVLNARDEAALTRLAEEIGNALVVAGDIAETETARRMVESARQRFGRVDSVIHNAAIIEPIAPIAEAESDAWMRHFQVNVIGGVNLIRFALPFLREREGRAILVSSGAAVHPMRGWGAYCASKAAVNHLTRVLAAEEPRVTAIAFRPGIVDTPMQATLREKGRGKMPPEEYARFVQYYESGMLMPPEVPGAALASLALAAPREWSGEFLSWDDEKVQALG